MGYAKGKFRLGFTLSDLIPGAPHAKYRTPGAGEGARGGCGLGFVVSVLILRTLAANFEPQRQNIEPQPPFAACNESKGTGHDLPFWVCSDCTGWPP